MPKVLEFIPRGLHKLLRYLFSHFIKFSIQIKLFISSIIITVLVIAIVFYVFQIFILRLVLEQQVTYSLNFYEYANQTLKSNHDELEISVKGINNSEVLTKILKNNDDKTDIVSLSNNVANIEAEISRVFPKQNIINSVILVGVNRFAYVYTKSSRGQFLGRISEFERFYDDLSTLVKTDEEESVPVYSIVPENFKGEDTCECQIFKLLDGQIALIRTLKNFKNELTGLVAITVDTRAFFEIFSGQEEYVTVMIMDRRNNLIWSNRNNGEYIDLLGSIGQNNGEYQTRTVNNKNVLCIYKNLQPFQFQVISVIPYEKIYKGSSEIMLMIGIYSVICILYVLLMSYLYSRNISSPINELLKKLMDEIKEEVKKKNFILVPARSRNSLRYRLAYYFVLSSILPNPIFAVISFNSFFKFYKENVVYYSSNTLKLARHYFDSKIEEYDLMLKQIGYNERIQEIFRKFSNNTLTKEDTEYVSDLLLNVKSNRKEQINVALYDPSGSIIYSTEYFSVNDNNPAIKNFVPQLKESIGELVLLGIGKNYYLEPEMGFGRKIRYLKSHDGKFGSTIGYIKLGVSSESVERIVMNAREDLPSHIALTDNKMNYLTFDDPVPEHLIANNKRYFEDYKEKAGTLRYDNRNYTVISEKGQAGNIGYLKIIPEDGLKQKLDPFYRNSIIIALVILGLVLANSYLIYISILYPLNRLLVDMQNIVEGSGKPVRTNIFIRDEISYIAIKINELLSEMNRLIHENYESRIREKELMLLQKEAQFAALQRQINPHFLYNTLESINWVAYKAQVKDICNMVSALGRFLRWGLSGGKTVRIIDEINYLNDYIFIQEMRYQGRLQFTLNIKEEVFERKILKLVLQPIVENAIIHGIDHMKRGGEILIRGYAVKDSIVLSVRDNGAGMDEKKLREVTEQLEKPQQDNKSSIGLSNVYSRLRLYYGENFRMQIKSKPGKGTVTRLIIPAAD
ncbi:MAG TPA: sensor histidine kinase [Clostridiaceae bacterium]|nr:sensor histidine kinase [Clostridiaceae bacterium]